jgi:DMSO/TMAO reductase YedYZ heme-binding membrane subunit
VSNKPLHPWHLRYVRAAVYSILAAAAIGIALVSLSGATDSIAAWVAAREFYGLWSLGLLIAAMAPGPLIFVMPWLPIRPHLMLARRALGVSAFVLATLHVGTYLGPTVYRNWRDLYTPGRLWLAGLVLGLPLYADMAVLAFTSRDSAVRELGPKLWKKWHRTVYLILPLALIHATFLGADFGVNKGPDVAGQPDAGSLIGMLIAAGAWFLFFYLRKLRIRIGN